MYTKKSNKNNYVKKDLGDKKKKEGKKRSKKTNKKKSTKKRKSLKKKKQGGAPAPPPSPSPVRSNDYVSTTPLNEVMTIKKPSFLDSQYNYGNNAHDCVYVGIGCFIKNDTYYNNDNFNRIKKYQMLPFFLKYFNHPLIILIDKLEDDDRIKREMNECITTIQQENPQFHPRIYWINGLFQPDDDRILENSISHGKLKDFLENGTFFQNADQNFTENNLFLCNYARFWGRPNRETRIGNLIPKSLQKIISELRVELNDSNNFIEQNRTYIEKLGALRDNNNLFSHGNDEISFIFPTYEYIILDEPSDSNLTLPMEIPPKKTFEYLYISRSEYIESFSLRKIVNIANDIAVNPSVSNDFFDFFFKKITPP
jgi:hypothetical protein